MTDELLLVDREAGIWRAGIATAMMLGVRHQGADLADHVVETRGWAALSIKATVLDVHIHPEMISDRCAQAVIRLAWLAKRRRNRLRLSGPHSGRYSLTDRVQLNTMLTAFVSGHRQASAMVCSGHEHPMSPAQRELAANLYQLGWDFESFGELQHRFEQLTDYGWSLWDLDGRESDPFCIASGKGMLPWIGIKGRHAGYSLRTFVDEGYANFVARTFKSVIERGVALTDTVEARTEFRVGGVAVLRYRRLIVPIRRRDGTRLILSTTLSRDTTTLLNAP